MRQQIFISKGQAVINRDGLRCAAPSTRPNRVKLEESNNPAPQQRCNRLLAKRNTSGQIAGDFRCDRCGQNVEVRFGYAAQVDAPQGVSIQRTTGSTGYSN